MTDVILYEPPETPGIYDQAAAAYIEFVESKNRAPKWNELIDALYKENGKDWIDRSTLHGLLRRKEFQELLAQKRKEHLVVTLAPRLLMGQLSAKLSSEAASELLERLGDAERRMDMETKDLITLMKTCADLAEKVDTQTTQDSSDKQAVNRGTILNLFTQMSPERAAVIAQEIARQQLSKERGGDDSS